MEYQQKLNEKYSLFLHGISSFESSASYKNVKDVKDTATSSFITCCLFITHNIFEILSTLIEKRFLSQIFLLQWIYTHPTTTTHFERDCFPMLFERMANQQKPGTAKAQINK